MSQNLHILQKVLIYTALLLFGIALLFDSIDFGFMLVRQSVPLGIGLIVMACLLLTTLALEIRGRNKRPRRK